MILIVMRQEPVIDMTSEQIDHRAHLRFISLPAAVDNDQSAVDIITHGIEHSLAPVIVTELGQRPRGAARSRRLRHGRLIITKINSDLNCLYRSMLFGDTRHLTVTYPLLPVLACDCNAIRHVVHERIRAVQEYLDSINSIILSI